MQETTDQPGVDDPGAGRRIGVDVGTVRMGVSVSDRDARLAMPVETIRRRTGFNDPDQADIERLLEIIADYDAVEVVIGLPRNLDSSGSASVKHAKEIAARLRRRLEEGEKSIPVRLADERLTTVIATQALQASGVSARAGRSVIDQAAAVEILQSWLDGRARALAQATSNTPEGVEEAEGDFADE